MQVVKLDINEDRSVKDAIDKIVAERKRIDVLVNNAVYGLFGSLEGVSIEEVKAQFETNFFGVIRVTQQVLPVTRKQQNSTVTIVNVSSVGGRMGVPDLSVYQSTKFALEGLRMTILFLYSGYIILR